jgi:ABC-type nickel/cobalt efflux system permease component RcnA
MFVFATNKKKRYKNMKRLLPDTHTLTHTHTHSHTHAHTHAHTHTHRLEYEYTANPSNYRSVKEVFFFFLYKIENKGKSIQRSLFKEAFSKK